ncbi:MAG TPA: hypothetical protein VJV23_01380 [Candidatus Polarisedimenticolia bacterium]|nr:hypothetical protein [Candidatus Polarisedimenticolia bacterium]
MVEPPGGGGALDEEARWALEQVPPWAAGVALPGSSTAIVRADRIGRYPGREMLAVVAHEMTHLLVEHAARPEAAGTGSRAGSMPRWFKEGVAASLARQGEWMDFVHLWLSPVTRSGRPLDEIESRLAGASTAEATRAAYAGAFSFAGHLMERHSDRFPALVLQRMRAGRGFREAFTEIAGAPPEAEAAIWSSRLAGRLRWITVATSSFAFWAAVTVLFLAAVIWRRRRSRAILRRWELEERQEEGSAPADGL